ncbi:A24 family peptidase [Clostridium algoriphilum]|uniref:prepilin peptidase n=1 Tax=Clostridium algoriphilum TaxID=198347 RepID=UPI001CF1D9AD|nr:A24 family peptidase [Clostridium algoriphilum]MCB2294202.1 A24 family peptidase [Clostridium algoriphilum]
MAIMFFLGGLVTGCFLSVGIKKISRMVAYKKNSEKYINILDSKTRNIIVILISGLLFLISFLQIGINVIFIKALVLNSILIVVSFIDLEHQIIPNKIIIFTLVFGIFFSFVDDVSFMSAVVGMIFGGGVLLLLALVPGVMGGGDIKLMFVLGIFLGAKGVLFALFLAFAIASIISILLMLFKIKKRRDYIPFGPFLALGSFIVFNFF